MVTNKGWDGSGTNEHQRIVHLEGNPTIKSSQKERGDCVDNSVLCENVK